MGGTEVSGFPQNLQEREERCARERLAGWKTAEQKRRHDRRAVGVCVKCGVGKKPLHGRGLCESCYHRWNKTGKPRDKNGKPDLAQFDAAPGKVVQK